VYYKAQRQAMTNGAEFHLAAFTNNGFVGTNRPKCTSKFRKRYKNDSEFHYELHAEVDLILRCDKVPEKIRVMRFMKDGTRTMARPCVHCQNFLKHAGVKTVMFTNWDGRWEEMKL
jgi:hypothetical protein